MLSIRLTFTYEKENDQQLPSFVRTTRCRDRNKVLDTEDSRIAAAIDKRVQEKKDKKVENERATAAAAGLQTIGKDDRDK